MGSSFHSGSLDRNAAVGEDDHDDERDPNVEELPQKVTFKVPMFEFCCTTLRHVPKLWGAY